MAGDGKIIDVSEVHPTHQPEGPDRYLMSGLCWCKVCCKLVATEMRGARSIGRRPCAGPTRIELRGDGMVFAPSTKEPTNP
jgi:hypothetical protein